MKKNFFIVLALLNAVAFSQKNNSQFKLGQESREYFNKGALPYIEESLLLNTDNTFQHTFKDKQITEIVSGKWKAIEDTLLLYDYLKEKDIVRFQGMETQVSFHDSVEIHFVDETGQAWTPRLFINGKCLNGFPPKDFKYVIPKMHIQTISVLGGIYYVQNKNSNNFLINYKNSLPSMKVSFVHRISRCLIKEKYLIRIDCENYVDEGYRLEKK